MKLRMKIMKKLFLIGCLVILIISTSCRPNLPFMVDFETGTYSEQSDETSDLESTHNTSSVDSGQPDVSEATSQPKTEPKLDLSALYPEHKIFRPKSSEQRWNYINLNSKHRELYKKLYNAVLDMTEGMFSLGKCTYNELVLIYNAVKNDHPELFWIPDQFAYETDSQGNIRMAFKYTFKDGHSIDYLYNAAQRETMIAQIKNVIADSLRYINPNMGFYEKELALHEWLTFRVTYDHSASQDQSQNPNAFNIYGALVEGRAVCEGYSRAMQLLLEYVGIDCIVITGKIEDTGHMWNMVKLDGDWYHLDATWNDSEDSGYHSYFNVTDNTIMADHEIDPDFTSLSSTGLNPGHSFNINRPIAQTFRYNYFNVNNTLINSHETMGETIANALVEAASLGKNSCEFAFSDDYDRVYEKPAAILQEIKLMRCIERANFKSEVKINISRLYCEGISGTKGFRLRW